MVSAIYRALEARYILCKTSELSETPKPLVKFAYLMVDAKLEAREVVDEERKSPKTGSGNGRSKRTRPPPARHHPRLAFASFRMSLCHERLPSAMWYVFSGLWCTLAQLGGQNDPTQSLALGLLNIPLPCPSAHN